MKKIIIVSISLFIFTFAQAENKTVNFTVNPPLVCHNCENKVKENIRFEKGVKSVKPSAKKGMIEITYDDSKTDEEKLSQALKKIGYEARVKEEKQNEISD